MINSFEQLSIYSQPVCNTCDANFPAALGRREGGVRGVAPSFVEFSTVVRSWRAVLSWVGGVGMRAARGSTAEAGWGWGTEP